MCPELPDERSIGRPPYDVNVPTYRCPHGKSGTMDCPWCRVSQAISMLIGDTRIVHEIEVKLQVENERLRIVVQSLKQELQEEKQK